MEAWKRRAQEEKKIEDWNTEDKEMRKASWINASKNEKETENWMWEGRQ